MSINAKTAQEAQAEGLLEGRMAHCYCDRPPVPSDPGLAFFEFEGEGSDWDLDRCLVCRYSEGTHHPEHFERSVRSWEFHLSALARQGIQPHEFVRSGARDHDTYYCGCRGWD